MKRYFLILLPLVVIWLWSIGFNFYSGVGEGEKLQFQLINRVSPILEKRYQMALAGVGGGQNEEGIHRIRVSYHRKQGAVSLEEARRMILDCLDEYLTAINSDEKLKPFLSNYPFMPKNISFRIINYEKDGGDLFDPDIEVISTVENKIYYDTRDPENCDRYKSKMSELIEDAYTVLQET